MPFKLLLAQELEEITGKKRSSAQANWFKANFGVEVVRRAEGTVVITADALEALMRKRMGIRMPGAQDFPRERPPVYSVRKRAGGDQGALTHIIL